MVYNSRSLVDIDVSISFKDADLYSKLMDGQMLGEHYAGYHILQSSTLQELGTVKERLISNTGKPRGVSRYVERMVPDTKIYILDDHTYLCHPAVYDNLRAVIDGG